MSKPMKWSEYVRAVTGTAQQKEIAKEVKVSQGTISRWLTGESVPTDAGIVTVFAQAYKRPVLEAYVVAGMLSAEEAHLPSDSLDDLRPAGAKKRKRVKYDPKVKPRRPPRTKGRQGLP